MFMKDKLKLTRLPVMKIMPNPSQPRKIFQEDELRSLAQSIAENVFIDKRRVLNHKSHARNAGGGINKTHMFDILYTF